MASPVEHLNGIAGSESQHVNQVRRFIVRQLHD